MPVPRLVFALLPVLLACVGCGVAEAEPAADDDPAIDAPVAGPFDEGAVPAELADAALKVRDQPIGVRMAVISELLMGTPYLIDAAGEGVAPDLDPPARYDVFDCLTFVEEILALAIPSDPRNAPMVRNSLRWGQDRERTYENRHHFMLQEWVPRAIENGWLKDITPTLGETHRVTKTVTARTWSNWKKRALFELPDARLPTGDFELQVMSLGEARLIADQIPDGALILTVRNNKGYIPIVVSHLGFKVPSATPDEPLFRHATKMGKTPRVRNDRLKYYLEHVRWYHWWPVDGVTILMPQEAGPRVARAVARPSSTALVRRAAP